MSAAHIPAHLEPSGVARADGKRSDDISMVGKRGNLLCGIHHAETPWHHRIPPPMKRFASTETESEEKKYSSHGAKYFLVSVACESLGVFGAESFFLKDLGHHLHQSTGGSQSYQFLLQCLLWQSREEMQHPSWRTKVYF